MSDQASPFTQRVRRLIGSGVPDPQASPPPNRPQSEPPPPPPGPRFLDTGVLFESQIGRLSAALRDLRAIDRQREAELRALRERAAIADAVARATLAAQIAPALARIDALIHEAARLLQPLPELPPGATLFERMRARRTAASLTPTQRDALVAWAAMLADLRTQLAELMED
ncbi:MAG: hypothetical protein OHK0015_05200 [Chloroflexi bacterium OHK40]